MSDEAEIAFAPLVRRAERMPDGATPPDRISVRDHVVEVEIGAFQAERDTTQRIRFSVVVEVAPSDGAATDDVDDILSYDTITEAIAAELGAERLNLLETLAERIADRILREPQPLRVFVRIEKLDRGPGNLGVEIVRSRDAVQSQKGALDVTINPLVVFLGNEATGHDDLSALLNRLVADPRPVILCVAPVNDTAPRVDATVPQLRIDLLLIEQAAWQLSARNPQCVVVETRTELDWGMKNGQLSVWAPSKLVLDAVDGPADADPATLATWLAAELEADQFVLVGEDTIGDAP